MYAEKLSFSMLIRQKLYQNKICHVVGALENKLEYT